MGELVEDPATVEDSGPGELVPSPVTLVPGCGNACARALVDELELLGRLTSMSIPLSISC